RGEASRKIGRDALTVATDETRIKHGDRRAFCFSLFPVRPAVFEERQTLAGRLPFVPFILRRFQGPLLPLDCLVEVAVLGARGSQGGQKVARLPGGQITSLGCVSTCLLSMTTLGVRAGGQ